MKNSIFVVLLSGMLLAFNSWADGPELKSKPQLSAEQLTGSCDRALLQDHLHDYNLTRLQLAGVLRFLANDHPMQLATRERLIDYADNLEAMLADLPAPDPSSSEFANFDFRLGLTFISMTVFLNTAEDSLKARFESDRDNPSSKLGIYLARLDQSRAAYESDIAAAKSGPCTG